MGKSTFVPGLWVASLLFYVVNTWILGIIVKDVGIRPVSSAVGKEGVRGEIQGNEKKKV